MFSKYFSNQLFPGKTSFSLALALFAFNVFVVCLFALLYAVIGIPDPVSQISGFATIEDAKTLLALGGFWSIGNTLLLLGFLDAVKPATTA